MTIVDLVDSLEYASTNCYVHQLSACIDEIPGVQRVQLSNIKNLKPSGIICRLKQRTIYNVIDGLRSWIGDVPFVVYDQDPWHAYMDDSPFKGTYEKLRSLNLRSIAVTTEWWANFIKARNLPGNFVRMGMLQSYCDAGREFSQRSRAVAFIGSLHPRRQRLFDEMKELGTLVSTQRNVLTYPQYLDALNDVGIFIHNEDQPITVDGVTENMGTGMWIKDVEAAARGCFSIRNKEVGSASYCKEIPSIRFYESTKHACELIKEIVQMDTITRNKIQRESVEIVRSQNSWKNTANFLVQSCL